MSRKNITEWRELIKRAVKRGELEKLAAEPQSCDKTDELDDKLSEILARCGITLPSAEPSVVDNTPSPEFDEAMRIARAAAGVSAPESSAPYIPEEPKEVEEELPVADFLGSLELTMPEEDDVAEEEIPAPAKEGFSRESQSSLSDMPFRTPAVSDDEYIPSANPYAPSDEAAAAKRTYEEELERLRREHDALRAENERLAKAAEEAENIRRREEEARIQQEARLREQLELEARERAREKLLFAEAARLAREENERLEKERLEAEARRVAEAARLEAVRREEEQRLAAEQQAIAEARRREEEARQRVDAKATAAERARAAMQRMAEDARRRADSALGSMNDKPMAASSPELPPEPAPMQASIPEPQVAPVPQEPKIEYTYTSKLVRLLFRHNVDPNVTSRIHEMISVALSYFHKEQVYIKVKASIPDSSTVLLNFVKIPEEEMELLVNIIKFLGNSDLGISKVILE